MPASLLLANRYRPVRILGEGAMGLVWAVVDTTNGQQVALKVISKTYGTTPKSVLQFKQEFRLMTLLRHPNCCAVYDYGVLENGEPYFTMEEVTGHGLDELAPLSPERVTAILPQLLLALGYVHQRGLVHRDLKSANVRVRPDGSLKLMDYGLMEFARRSGAAIAGTAAYLAPEVITRGSVDQRADLYAVGVLAYEMLTGRVPFEGEPMAVLRAQLDTAPRPLEGLVPGLDPRLGFVIAKLLEKNPLARFQSTSQVLEALGYAAPAGYGGNLLQSPLMGREPEMRALGERLQAVAHGEAGGAMVLHGPSGIGKSRLVEEFRYAVQLAELPCVVGASHEHGNAPYDPFVAILKGLIPALKAHTPQALEQHGPILRQLLPELDGQMAEALDSPTKDRLRLQATITELFRGLAERRGFVAVLEDWQWADDLSVELLDYMLRNTAHQPMLLLVTSRVAPAGPLATSPALPLQHLDDTGIQRMVTAMLGAEAVSPRFLQQVGALSKGVPFFVEKLLEHLVQDQTLINVRGRWNTDAELPIQRLPNNLKGLLMWRITCLDESAQNLAHAGAVVGREFSLDLLQRLTGVSDDDLFAAVEALALNQVLVQTAPGTYTFAQDQFQELLYTTMEAPLKARWHTAIARELARGRDAEHAPLELVSAIAHHHLLGDDAKATIVWALEAGRRAAGLFANADAEALLKSGLALAKAAEDGAWRKERMEYWRLLGDVWRVTGRNADAKDAYQEAIVLAGDLGEYDVLGRMMTYLGRCHQVLGALPDALEACRLSLAITLAGSDAAGAARCLVQTGRIHYFMGNTAAAIDHAEQALALARESGLRGQEGEALGMLGYFYVASDPERVQLGVSHLDQSVAILSELGDRIALVNSYNFLGTAQNMLGNHVGALDSFAHNRRIAREIGARDDEIFALLNLAITAFELGDFAEMHAMAQAAEAMAHELDSRFPWGMALTLGAVAEAYMGRLGAVRERLKTALALAVELNHKYMISQVLMYQVDVLLHLGRLDEALEQGQALQALIKETGDRDPEARLHVLLAEVQGRLGDMRRARIHVEAAMDASLAAHARGMQVRARAAAAWLALAVGDWQAARDVAEKALGLAKQLGSQYQVARLYGMVGSALIALEQPGAEACFEAAGAIARSIGAPALDALTRFGLAVAQPHDARALANVGTAQAMLRQLAAQLEPDDRACFLAVAERRRVLTGSHAGEGA